MLNITNCLSQPPLEPLPAKPKKDGRNLLKRMQDITEGPFMLVKNSMEAKTPIKVEGRAYSVLMGVEILWRRPNAPSVASLTFGRVCQIQPSSYWRAIKAAANELTRIKLPRLNANPQSYQIDV